LRWWARIASEILIKEKTTEQEIQKARMKGKREMKTVKGGSKRAMKNNETTEEKREENKGRERERKKGKIMK
jgi:hypothetical protein